MKRKLFFVLFLFALVFVLPNPSFAQTPVPTLPVGPNTFLETFTGSPKNPDGTYANDAPKIFKSDKWSNTIHERDNYNNFLDLTDEMISNHGGDCTPPPNTHKFQDTNHAIYNCRDHIMTAFDPAGYGLIYLVPNAMADWSTQEAVIRWDMSTFRTSGRDWVDIEIQPFAENNQLSVPNGNAPEDLGMAQNSLILQMRIQHLDASPDTCLFDLIEFRNGTRSETLSGSSNSYCLNSAVASLPLNARPTFEIQISPPNSAGAGKQHVKMWMPGYNIVFIDKDINNLTTAQGTPWTQGVVMFGNHNYTAIKGCITNVGRTIPFPTTGNCANTWHWDNFYISPSKPFTVIKAYEDRIVSSELPYQVNFAYPAPSNSYLRFIGLSSNLDGGMKVSFDDGVTWEKAQLQTKNPAQSEDAEGSQWHSYWTPVPAGTKKARIAGQRGTGNYEVHMRDIAVWSQTLIDTTQPKLPSPTPPPQPNPNCPNNMFKASYYGTSRCEPPMIYIASNDPPIGGGCCRFDATWEGKFNFNQGNYEFMANTQHTVSIFVDNVQILSRNGIGLGKATKAMTSGLHDVRVVYNKAWERPNFLYAAWSQTSGTMPTNNPTPTAGSSSPTPTPNKPGDVDGDGVVGVFDYNEVVKAFGLRGTGIPADLIPDGVVNSLDLNEVIANYGR